MPELVSVNLDPAIYQYIDVIDIDGPAIDEAAEALGVKTKLEKRSEHSGKDIEPVGVNVHGCAWVSTENGHLSISGGHYNLFSEQIGDMPPADIDIFLGSFVLMARSEKDSTIERDLYTNGQLNLILMHELSHFADPNNPLEVLEEGQRFKYPGEADALSAPEIIAKAIAYTRGEEDLKSSMSGLFTLDLVSSGAAGTVVTKLTHELSYGIGVGTTAFIGGLTLTGKFYQSRAKKVAELAQELAHSRYEADPSEKYARSKTESIGNKKLIDVGIGSYAIRHVPVRTEYQ